MFKAGKPNDFHDAARVPLDLVPSALRQGKISLGSPVWIIPKSADRAALMAQVHRLASLQAFMRDIYARSARMVERSGQDLYAGGQPQVENDASPLGAILIALDDGLTARYPGWDGLPADYDPRQRPSAAEVLTHPYFWDPNKRLNFLQDASDRFEIMDKDPPTAALVLLESRARNVLGTDWHRRCDKMFLDNLGKFRKYDPSSVQDLLRAMRNKKHHYQDLPPTLKKILGSLPDGYLNYFTRRFPELFLHVYNTIIQQPLIRTEPVFREYFHCAEPDH